jgi:hypothetical protein
MWEIFLGVFVQWIATALLPEVAALMKLRCATIAPKQKKHWHPPQVEELIAYFLWQFLASAVSSSEQTLDKKKLQATQKNLVGISRRKVLNTALNLGNDQMLKVTECISSFIQRFVTLGGAVVIDEAIWSFFSKNAKDRRQTRHIPEKPHPDGILTYIVCQRLHFSQRPIPLGFVPVYLNPRPSPLEALMKMVSALQVGPNPLPPNFLTIADSLWNYPSYILAMGQLSMKYVISSKSNSNIVPAALRNVGSTDLARGHARSYSDGFITLQLYHSKRGITGLISNAFKETGKEIPPKLPVIPYSNAVALYLSNDPAALIQLFQLPQECITLSKAQIIHQHTGWDVLRPEDKQGDTGHLTAEMLNGLDKARVTDIFKSTFPSLNVRKYNTLAKMVAELCPPDDIETPSTPHQAKKRKVEIAILDRQIKEAQGSTTTTHKVYDVFHTYHACIDQLDREYYQHGHLRYRHGTTHATLCCIGYYLLATVRAINDEYEREKIHTQSQGNNAAVVAHECPSMPDFLHELTRSYKEHRKEISAAIQQDVEVDEQSE